MGTDIRIIGDDDREAPQGEAGEIVSRGRITMPGYYRRRSDGDGRLARAEGRPWLRTGDIGRLDEQDFLYIVDRKKDMILSGGQNVYPQDIEAAAREPRRRRRRRGNRLAEQAMGGNARGDRRTTATA